MKKRVFYTEAAYVWGLLLLAFAGALSARADLGMSMVIAPAYILHLELCQYWPWFTFGVSSYVFQGLLLLLVMAVMKRFRLSYLLSFVTAVLYGLCLDGFMWAVSFLPNDTMALRLVWYGVSTVVCSFAVSLFFKTYLPPEAYELIVKEFAEGFGWKIHRVKSVYDVSSTLLSVVLSFAFFGFGVFQGVKWGTILCALVNGFLIGQFTRLTEHFFEFKNRWKPSRLFD